MKLKIIRGCNTVVSVAIVTFSLLILLVGVYARWDSNVVENEAKPEVYAQYKPGEEKLSFGELQKINPEVIGWISIYGTPIDYPIAHTTDNMKYLSINAKLEPSLTGSIYLDYENNSKFLDFNNILYGHNMTPAVMFGSIRSFIKEKYFESHKYGNIYANGKNQGLRIIGLVEADAYDQTIYHPGIVGAAQRTSYINLLKAKSRYWRDNIKVTAKDHIVLLSTCSSTATNGREILVAKMTKQTYKNPFPTADDKVNGVNAQNIWKRVPIWLWIVLAIIVFMLIVGVYKARKRKKDDEKSEKN